jgi:hypothetical protein
MFAVGFRRYKPYDIYLISLPLATNPIKPDRGMPKPAHHKRIRLRLGTLLDQVS